MAANRACQLWFVEGWVNPAFPIGLDGAAARTGPALLMELLRQVGLRFSLSSTLTAGNYLMITSSLEVSMYSSASPAPIVPTTWSVFAIVVRMGT